MQAREESSRAVQLSWKKKYLSRKRRTLLSLSCSRIHYSYDLPRMESEKNKMRNTHRRVVKSRKRKYRKKKVSQVRMGEQHVNSPEVSEREKDGEGSVKVEGSRIINIHKVSEYWNELTVHAAKCGGAFTLDGEMRDGLASILSGRCSVCRDAIQLETSPKN